MTTNHIQQLHAGALAAYCVFPPPRARVPPFCPDARIFLCPSGYFPASISGTREGRARKILPATWITTYRPTMDVAFLEGRDRAGNCKPRQSRGPKRFSRRLPGMAAGAPNFPDGRLTGTAGRGWGARAWFSERSVGTGGQDSFIFSPMAGGGKKKKEKVLAEKERNSKLAGRLPPAEPRGHSAWLRRNTGGGTLYAKILRQRFLHTRPIKKHASALQAKA